MTNANDWEDRLDRLTWAEGLVEKAKEDFRRVAKKITKEFPEAGDIESARELAKEHAPNLPKEFETIISRVDYISKPIEELKTELGE